jgi:hypothetical protein
MNRASVAVSDQYMSSVTGWLFEAREIAVVVAASSFTTEFNAIRPQH